LKNGQKIAIFGLFLLKNGNFSFNMLLLGTYDMTLEYRIIRETEIDNLEVVINSFVEDEYRVISIV
jgi:hypothetical protein